MFSDLTKTNVGILADTVYGRSFKLCIIMTLLGV